MVNNIVPICIVELLNDFRVTGGIVTRGQVMGNLTMGKKSFICSGISILNQLDSGIKGLLIFCKFKQQIKSKFMVNPPLISHDTTRKNQIIFMQIRFDFFLIFRGIYIAEVVSRVVDILVAH